MLRYYVNILADLELCLQPSQFYPSKFLLNVVYYEGILDLQITLCNSSVLVRHWQYLMITPSNRIEQIGLPLKVKTPLLFSFAYDQPQIVFVFKYSEVSVFLQLIFNVITVFFFSQWSL